jgi:hypothetical protein
MTHFQEFFPAICAGFGLFLAGAVNLMLIRCGIALRWVATLLALALAVAAAEAIDQPGATIGTMRLLAYGMIPFVILGSRSFGSRAAALVTAAQRPVIRFTALTVVGVGTVLGSIIIYERADKAASEAQLSEIEVLDSRSPSVPASHGKAATDRGTEIILRELVSTRDENDLTGAEQRVLHSTQLNDYVIRRSSADDRSNCHGWVFTGGRYLINSESVEMILKENGYQEQPDPQPGDLVVYRTNGIVCHTAVVRYVSEGQPVLVEGKWGELGVFLHQPDKSPYGLEFSYYRSNRRGHTLVGIGGTAGTNEANSHVSTKQVED